MHPFLLVAPALLCATVAVFCAVSVVADVQSGLIRATSREAASWAALAAVALASAVIALIPVLAWAAAR